MENEPFGQPSEIETLAERARLAKRHFNAIRLAMIGILGVVMLCVLGLMQWATTLPKERPKTPQPIPVWFWLLSGGMMAGAFSILGLGVYLYFARKRWWAAAEEHFEAEKRARIAAQVSETQQG